MGRQYNVAVKKSSYFTDQFKFALIQKTNVMTLIRMDICRCPCHTTPGMKHVRPCCSVCPTCGQNIADHSYRNHIEDCGKDVKQLDQKINEQKPTQE